MKISCAWLNCPAGISLFLSFFNALILSIGKYSQAQTSSTYTLYFCDYALVQLEGLENKKRLYKLA